jgi:hypothetical protein
MVVAFSPPVPRSWPEMILAWRAPGRWRCWSSGCSRVSANWSRWCTEGGCSWRSRSGCEPGKTIGVGAGVADVVDEPDERFEVCPDRYARCKESLDNAFDTVTVDTVRVRRRWRMWIHHHRKSPSITRRCGGSGSRQRLPAELGPGCGVSRPPGAGTQGAMSQSWARSIRD